GEARVAPLRAVDTTTLTIPAAPPATGRLRLVTAGVTTPEKTGAWMGAPLWLDRPPPPGWRAPGAGAAGLPPARAARHPAGGGAVSAGESRGHPPGNWASRVARCRATGRCHRAGRVRLRPCRRAAAHPAVRGGTGWRGTGRRG